MEISFISLKEQSILYNMIKVLILANFFFHNLYPFFNALICPDVILVKEESPACFLKRANTLICRLGSKAT